MRRILAALFLLGFALSRAFAAECPALPGSPGSGAGDVAAAHPHDTHGSHAPAEHAPVDPGHHAGGVCPMASACGIVGAPAAGAADAPPDLARTAAFLAPADPHASPYIGSDPPPPRPS